MPRTPGWALAASALVSACGGQTAGAASLAGNDAGASDATTLDAANVADASDGAPPNPYAAQCVNAAVPPDTIECTGLYTDVVGKVIAPGIRSFAPSVPLWADFASKDRWIWLPPGTTIDGTDPNEWVFPVGTKVWKEFSRDGKRVETRLWQKVQSNYWVRTTYAWNADESEATSSPGGDMPWGTDGGIYHIPTGDECDQCHRGRPDHLLGFEQVSLGLPGASGLTLRELVAENLISPVPASTALTIGDDGTGEAAPALAWLHINCGVSCHNGDSNSTAYGSGLQMRLDPTFLDGRSSASFDTRTTALNVAATTPTWSGQTRIVPGDPTHSLLVKLITNRGTDNPVANQMPPIGSLIVDQPDTQTVIDWISKMPPMTPPMVDAGVTDAGSIDAESVDATDAAIADASGSATGD